MCGRLLSIADKCQTPLTLDCRLRQRLRTRSASEEGPFYWRAALVSTLRSVAHDAADPGDVDGRGVEIGERPGGTGIGVGCRVRARVEVDHDVERGTRVR